MDPSDPDFKYLGVDRKALMKEQSTFDAKNVLWVEDEKEGYVLADIVQTTGDTIVVRMKDGTYERLWQPSAAQAILKLAVRVPVSLL
ncbi:hypothetical protein P879_11121 [Paragonimus westermani]|uniref:Myosin N-terminal SH3-like domain-containing protein n=1 Tax=Paragonimus westermani TaxID=34504 RepID=A0A8T0D725_9TREM|nr:hypothetical protein P879_11121 [Paragonimus westermani]